MTFARQRGRAHKRGYILVTVLLLMTVLLITASLVLTQTGDQVSVSVAVKGQAIAQSRATLGARLILGQIQVPAVYPQWQQIETLRYCKMPTTQCTPMQLLEDPSGCPCTARYLRQNPTGCVGYTAASPCLLNVSGTIDGFTISNGHLNRGVATDIDQGGGSQFQSFLVNLGKCRNPFDATVPLPDCNGQGFATPRYVIFSTGYYGYDPVDRPGSNRFESLVQMEITLPTPPADSGACESGYGGTC